MFFNKKETKDSAFAEMLKDNPNEMWVCSSFMAVYIPEIKKTLVILGDYSKLSEEEANLVFQMKYKTALHI